MHPLSEHAKFILNQMDEDRLYEPEELRPFVPDGSVEWLREIMHELWISRQVERVGYAGWRRYRSAPPNRADSVSREIEIVKPEDLFDHDRFADFFKS
jgi:hypothetical protein